MSSKINIPPLLFQSYKRYLSETFLKYGSKSMNHVLILWSLKWLFTQYMPCGLLMNTVYTWTPVIGRGDIMIKKRYLILLPLKKISHKELQCIVIAYNPEDYGNKRGLWKEERTLLNELTNAQCLYHFNHMNVGMVVSTYMGPRNV